MAKKNDKNHFQIFCDNCKKSGVQDDVIELLGEFAEGIGDTAINNVGTVMKAAESAVAVTGQEVITSVPAVKLFFALAKGIKVGVDSYNEGQIRKAISGISLDKDKKEGLVRKLVDSENNKKLVGLIKRVFEETYYENCQKKFDDELSKNLFLSYFSDESDITDQELHTCLDLVPKLNEKDIKFITKRQMPPDLEPEDHEIFINRLVHMDLLYPTKYFQIPDTESLRNTSIGNRISEASGIYLVNETDRKKKLIPDDFVSDMTRRGIVCDESAQDFILNECQYYRILAYRENYELGPEINGVKKYKNLNFDDLKQLYKIDNELSSVLLGMCLEIEQQLKVNLMSSIDRDTKDNGYELVEEYFKQHPEDQIRINRLNSSSYCSNLVSKYGYSGYPIWVLLELVSFRQLRDLLKIYTSKKSVKNYNKDIVEHVRKLRNAIAHNNSLIYCLKKNISNNSEPCAPITKWFDVFNGKNGHLNGHIYHFADEQKFKEKLTNRFIYDFTCLIYAYEKLMPKHVKQAGFERLRDVFEGCMLENASRLSTNEAISSTYYFFVRILYCVFLDNGLSVETKMFIITADELAKKKKKQKKAKKKKRSSKIKMLDTDSLN